MAGKDLTNTFIANTYQNLVQMPDLSKQEFYNGLGTTIPVINRDGIGTVKMFSPPGGNILTYFDGSGDGLAGSEWEGWSICDGHTPVVGAQTPNLSGKFVASYKAGDPEYALGYNGGSDSIYISSTQMPSHKHAMNFRMNSGGADVDVISKGIASSVGESYGYRETELTGGNDPVDNRPAYYVLFYVIRVH